MSEEQSSAFELLSLQQKNGRPTSQDVVCVELACWWMGCVVSLRDRPESHATGPMDGCVPRVRKGALVLL